MQLVNIRSILGRWFKRILIFLIALFLFITALIGLSAYLIQTPKVQNYVVDKIATYLSKKANTKIDIGTVEIKFFRRLRLNKFYVEDQKGDTLLFANHLDAHISLFRPLDKKIYLSKIDFDGVIFKGLRYKGRKEYNFSFLEKLFETKKVKDPNAPPFDIKVNKVNLKNFNLLFDDYEANFKSSLLFEKLFLDIEKLDFKQKSIKINKINFDNPVGNIVLLEKSTFKKDTINPSKEFFHINTGWDLKVKEFDLKNGNIRIEDKNLSNKPNKLPFDPKKFAVLDLNLQFKNANYDSTINLDLKRLSLSINNKLNLKEFKGKLNLSDKGFNANDLELLFNNSVLKANLSAECENLMDFKNLANNVYVNGKISECKLVKNDFVLFVPKAKPYLVDADLKGDIRGTFGNIKTENLKIKVGSNTILEGSGSIKGLPTINQTLLDLKVDRLNTTSTELKQLLSFTKLPKEINQLGRINFKGTFFGFVNDFVAAGTLNTDIGSIVTDLKIGFGKDPKNAKYSGTIQAIELNLGRFLKTNLVGTLTANLKLQGSGFTLDNVNSKISGTIDRFDLNNYRFRDIKVDGTLDKKLFNGKLAIDDECLFLDFLGKVDFNDAKNPIYDFNASILNADLQALNLTKEKMIISLDGYFDVHGLKVEDLVGNLNLTNLQIQNEKGTYQIPAIRANLAKDGLIRDYELFSDDFNGRIIGEFNPLIMPMQVYKFISGYSTYIDLKPPKDTLRTIPQKFNAHFNLASDLGLIRLFVPKFEAFSGLSLDVDFDNAISKLNVIANADSIYYGKIGLKGINIVGKTENDNFHLLTSLDSISSGKFKFNELEADFTTNESLLIGKLKAGPDTSLNQINLEARIAAIPKGVKLEILPSYIRVNGKDWEFLPYNSLTIKDSSIISENLALVQGDQAIRISNGTNTLNDAKISFENIILNDIANLGGAGKIVKSGILNGSAELRDIVTNLTVKGNLKIDSLNAAGFGVGSIALNADYDNITKNVLLNGKIIDRNYLIDLSGNYDIDTTIYEQANIDLDIQRLDLNFLEPALKYEISEMKAFCKAKAKFTGSYLKPILTGRAQLIDTAWVRINFLGTKFGLMSNADIILSENEIYIPDAFIMDTLGNKGTGVGKLKHEYFTKEWALDNMVIKTPKMLMLNTTYKDNQDYYGKAFMDGTVIFNGPTNNIVIDIDVKTLANTVLNLPISNTGGDKTYDFIEFIDKSDTSKTIETKYKTKLNGVTLKFKLDATPEAEVKLIFNEATNDFISARGTGNFGLDIDSKGAFVMRGEYVLSSGEYKFNFQNVITKTFKINPGSTISFSGDPLKADLNIDALYTIRASLGDLVTDSTSNLKNIRIPVDLVLQMRGPLDNSEVSFDIRLPQGQGTQNESVQNLLNQIKGDQTELNKQAFTLLILQKFIPINSGLIESANASDLSGTVYELLSSQVSTFLTDAVSSLITDVDIKVNYTTSSDNTTNSISARELALALSKKFFNDRLTINIGGNFEFQEANTTTNTSANTGIAGDFVIQYDITPDGRVKIKAYHRTQDFDIFNARRSKTGISISYGKDFDNIRELFRKEKNDKPAKKQKENVILQPPVLIKPNDDDLIQ